VAVKLRHNTNDYLLDIEYSKPKVIKDLLHNWKGLERLSLKGDRVATCVLVDLKIALGFDVIAVDRKHYIKMPEYRNKEVLTYNQWVSVVFVLVLGYTQPEVAHIFGIAQQGISRNISTGVKRIAKYLSKGVEKDDNSTD
jgi:hypothetical protein